MVILRLAVKQVKLMRVLLCFVDVAEHVLRDL